MVGENATSLMKAAIRSFGHARFRVLGTSMAPSVLPGDLVSVRRAELSEVSVGEIVLFSRPGRLFVHRVISCTTQNEIPFLITRGDRLRHDDPPVTSTELLGRVTSIERDSRAFEPDRELSMRNRVVVRVLRASELATRAYLHFLRRIQKRRGFLSPTIGEAPWAR